MGKVPEAPVPVVLVVPATLLVAALAVALVVALLAVLGVSWQASHVAPSVAWPRCRWGSGSQRIEPHRTLPLLPPRRLLAVEALLPQTLVVEVMLLRESAHMKSQGRQVRATLMAP
jgi:hypothetical protein